MRESYLSATFMTRADESSSPPTDANLSASSRRTDRDGRIANVSESRDVNYLRKSTFCKRACVVLSILSNPNMYLGRFTHNLVRLLYDYFTGEAKLHHSPYLEYLSL